MAKRDKFTKDWITENSIDIVSRYEDGVLTLRALHYQLVGLGMTNSTRHYKRVVSAMIDARWDNLVDFEAFSDHDREVLGETIIEQTVLEKQVEQAKRQIGLWMRNYYGNRWENQNNIPEVWIEKKALQGVFQGVCSRKGVALAPCKGYPSLTFLNDAAKRFEEVKKIGKNPVILYFGDYDASGEDIPRSIEANLTKLGCPVEVVRVALMHDQVIEMNLPPAPTKVGDSRAAKWDGIGQVELDAVPLDKIKELCGDAIDSFFDDNLYDELEERIDKERTDYQEQLKEYVIGLAGEQD